MAIPLGKPSDKADCPENPVPSGCGKMRCLRRYAPRCRSPATTFVARLASLRILPATQSAEDLIRGSLTAKMFYTWPTSHWG
jgi:hypothetical protein